MPDLGDMWLQDTPSNHALRDCVFVLQTFLRLLMQFWNYFEQLLLNLLLGNVGLRTRLQVRQQPDIKN